MISNGSKKETQQDKNKQGKSKSGWTISINDRRNYNG